MTSTVAATIVPAADLQTGDVFTYSGSDVEVREVTRLGSTLVEVHVLDEWASNGERFLDYGVNEGVEVTRGPSMEQAVAPLVQAVAPRFTALALGHVGGSRLRTLPTSAALVLYALAAVQDSGVATPSTAQVAAAAGLAPSTAQGHLRSLVAKGAVGARSLGWTVL